MPPPSGAEAARCATRAEVDESLWALNQNLEGVITGHSHTNLKAITKLRGALIDAGVISKDYFK